MTKQHTVYISAAQWDTIKTLDLDRGPNITQGDLLEGSEWSGHIVVSVGFGPDEVRTHIDPDGNILVRETT